MWLRETQLPNDNWSELNLLIKGPLMCNAYNFINTAEGSFVHLIIEYFENFD